MKAQRVRKYRASAKREATRLQNRAAIQAAAWEVFCTLGLDAANIRDIVNRSGLSPGTFYNYFPTKEAIFDVVAQDVLERIRDENRAARAQANTLEDLLYLSYRSYLSLLRSIPGAMQFIERNHPHVRSQLESSSAISGLAADLAKDLLRFLPKPGVSRQERQVIASILIAAGAEAVLGGRRTSHCTAASVSKFLTRFMIMGLSGFQRK